ncbi:MAG: hypothetical protein EBR82_31885 [Caulobacteraceae bacterium]|nr:hypothetical protein [Caulobacteraceae bacterium]
MKKTIKLNWVTDPSHGWLKVSRADVKKLGLNADSFSTYSYQSAKGTTFYLEEDCDAPILLKSLDESREFLPLWMMDRHTNGRSHVRLLRPIARTEIITKLWNDYALDQLESWIRDRINMRYNVPRPSDDYPWNAEMYREVYQACIDYIREHDHICYARRNGEIVVTTDTEQARRDISEKLAIDSRKLHIINVR